MLYGSLILESISKTVSDLPISMPQNAYKLEGHHVDGRGNGRWVEISDFPTGEVVMPQRQKNLLIRSNSISIIGLLETRLSTLDSEYLNRRQLYKLGQLLDSLTAEPPFVATVNMTSSENNTSSNGGFYLLSHGTPIYVYVVYDLKEKTTRLTWATFDIKLEIRSNDLTRYAFYEMPTLLDRPLFLPTQFICSRWYDFGHSFGKTKEAALTSCNALEVALYKDPKE